MRASIDDAIAPMSEIISPKSGIAIARAQIKMTRTYRKQRSQIIIDLSIRIFQF